MEENKAAQIRDELSEMFIQSMNIEKGFDMGATSKEFVKLLKGMNGMIGKNELSEIVQASR